MKKIALSLSAFLLYILSCFSQSSTERIYIKGGQSAWDNYMAHVYMNRAFSPGIVEYKNGKRYKSVLNYNRVIGAIQFIDEKGDTLALRDEQSIQSVSIGDTVFSFIPTCMQEVKDQGKLKLVKNVRVKIADKQKTGAYGIPNAAGTIDAVSRVDNSLNFRWLDVNESLLLSKTTNFYIETETAAVVPASKKNVFGLFPKQEEAIREFIKTNQINFSDEADLIELTGYLSHL